MARYRVRLMTLEGPFKIDRKVTCETPEECRRVIESYITSNGYSDLKEVPNDDPGCYRFTAKSPGGRYGRNVAFLDDMGGDFTGT